MAAMVGTEKSPEFNREGPAPALFAWVRAVLAPPRTARAPGLLGEAMASMRPHYRTAILFGAAVSVLYLSSSLYMMLVYDKVLHSGSLMTLGVLTLALIAALATLAVIDMARNRLLVRAGVRLERRLSGPVLDTVLSQGERGGRASQALRELDQFRTIITGAPATALMEAPWTPVFLAVLCLLHWSFGVFALIGAGLFVIVARWSEHRMREPAQRANAALLNANGAVEAAIRYAAPIRALGMTGGLKRRWLYRRANALGLAAETGSDAAAAGGLMKFLRLTWQGLGLALGAWLVIDRQITPGAMIAASILLGRTLAPLEQLVSAWRSLVTASDIYAQFETLLAGVRAEAGERTQLPRPAGHLECDRVVILGEGGKPIVAGVSFKLEPGECLCVAGPSGAGKTTLVRALMGLQRPDSGAVRLDGAELSQWPHEDLAAHVGYLPQDVALLPGTVRENVSRFQPPGDDVDIDAATVEACKRAGVHDLILRLPMGYDTPIEAGGLQLSGGQRQRIALARALYRGPAAVVLDEPNAHLDKDGETALMRTLESLKRAGVTVVLVTHRAPLAVVADKMMHLVEGRVTLYGPREQVLSRLSQGAQAGAPALAPVREGGVA